MDMANIRTTDSNLTDRIEHALTVAGRAPSIHNTQPWRWRLRGNEAGDHVRVQRPDHVTH